MKQTKNYNLKLPEYSDIIDVEDFNENFTIIDEQILQKLNLSSLAFEKDGKRYIAKLSFEGERPKIVAKEVGGVITEGGVVYEEPVNATETMLGRVKVVKNQGESGPYAVPTIGYIKEITDHPKVNLGLDSSGEGYSSVAIGQNTNSSGWRGISVGYEAEATEPSTITIGDRAKNTEQSGVVIGHAAINKSKRGISIGTNATIGENSAESIAIGRTASITNSSSVAIGFKATAEGIYSTCMGANSTATEESAISLGHNSNSTAIRSIAIGGHTRSSGFSSTAVGGNSKALVEGAVALGWSALSQGIHGVALGTNTVSRGYRTVSAGHSAEALHDYSAALGAGAKTTQAYQGVLGVPTSEKGVNTWLVPGDFSVGGTKNFEIPHPNPKKTETHVLRHGAVETNSQGDNLYRYKIEAKKDGDKVNIELPDYFIYLNKNVQIWATGVNHFGNAFGTYKPEEEVIEVTCEKAGEYNILAIGTRNDNNYSIQSWKDKGVEKLKGESWTFEVDKDIAENLSEYREEDYEFDDVEAVYEKGKEGM